MTSGAALKLLSVLLASRPLSNQRRASLVQLKIQIGRLFFLVSLEGLATFRADRSSALSGKSRGGGLGIYINNNWCNNARIFSSYCSPDIELLTVNCRPFYLPREFTVVIITALYVPPSANKKEALCVLYRNISELQLTQTGSFIVAGDFNLANMKTLLPHFHQHVDFATRGENTLDVAYTNIKDVFRAVPRPHLGSSDHVSVMLIRAYKPLLIRGKPTTRQVRTSASLRAS